MICILIVCTLSLIKVLYLFGAFIRRLYQWQSTNYNKIAY